MRADEVPRSVASSPAPGHTDVQNLVQEAIAPESISIEARQLTRSSRPRMRENRGPATAKIPDWVMPAIHKLCRSTGTIAAPPHMFVGVSTAFELFSTPPMTNRLDVKSLAGCQRLLALLVAVYLYVTFRLSGGHVTALRLESEAKNALRILRQPEDELGDKSHVELRDVHEWIAAFQDNGFLEMDWIKNVPKANPLENISDKSLTIVDEGLGIQRFRAQTDDEEANTLLPGLGTMVRLLIRCERYQAKFPTDARQSELSHSSQKV